jgi:hypothetical protein
MNDFSREDRGIFQGIKVPFCLNAIILAFMAYVIFVAGSQVIGWIVQDNVAYEKVVFSTTARIQRRLPTLTRPLGMLEKYSFAKRENVDEGFRKYRDASIKEGKMPVDYDKFILPEWWKLLIFAVWFLFIWSFFAGAINRTAAYRIARDESITLKEGLNFGAQTWLNHFLAILFLVIFIAAAFYICVLTAFILDLIPFVGELVLIFAFIFILVAAFLITLLLAGLLFGFNMISSAIGVDKVDSFDAISRAYSYILGRPWQTLLYTFLPFMFIVFFLYFGDIFQEIAVRSVAAGMGENFTPISNFVGGSTWEAATKGLDYTPAWTMHICALVLKIFLWLVQLFIISTAIAYWLSARTKAYLLLRKEVDGDEVEEMFLDEEEETFETPAPAPVAAAQEEKKEEKAPAKPEGEKHTEESLSGLTMDELRAIGEEFKATGRSKKKIIERILKAQEE